MCEINRHKRVKVKKKREGEIESKCMFIIHQGSNHGLYTKTFTSETSSDVSTLTDIADKIKARYALSSFDARWALVVTFNLMEYPNFKDQVCKLFFCLLHLLCLSSIYIASSPVAQCVAWRAPMQQCVRWLVHAPTSS